MATTDSLFDVNPEATIGQTAEGFTQPVDLLRSVGAAIQLSADSGTIASLIKLGDISKIADRNEGKPKLSVEELRQKYPEFAADFTDPMSEEGADYVVRNKTRRAELSRLVEQGPQGNIAGGIRFVAGLIPHAIDPVNWVAGLGTTALVGKLAMGTRAAALVEGTFARSVTEGVLGNVLTEPISAFATKKELEDYTAGQFFFNTVAGAVGMSAVGYAGRKIFGAIENRVLNAVSHDMTMRQISNDRFPDNSKLVEQFAGETNVKVPNQTSKLPVNTDYSYKPFDNDGRSFYQPTSAGGAVPDNTVRQLIGKHYGPGVYLSDNVVVANNRSASAFSNRVGDGTIREMDLSRAKLLALDAPLEAGLKSKLLADPELAKAVGEVSTGRELFDKVSSLEGNDKLPTGTTDALADYVKSQGYDGMHYTMDKDIIDRPHDPHNVAILFDDSKMDQRQYFSADSSIVPKPNTDDLRVMLQNEEAPARQLGYSPDDTTRLQGVYAVADEAKTDLDSVERGLNERIDQLTSQEKIENLPPEARAEYDGLVEAKRGIEQEREAWKALEECIRGG